MTGHPFAAFISSLDATNADSSGLVYSICVPRDDLTHSRVHCRGAGLVVCVNFILHYYAV